MRLTFDIFRGMADSEQVLTSYLQPWMVKGGWCHVARSRMGNISSKGKGHWLGDEGSYERRRKRRDGGS